MRRSERKHVAYRVHFLNDNLVRYQFMSGDMTWVIYLLCYHDCIKWPNDMIGYVHVTEKCRFLFFGQR